MSKQENTLRLADIDQQVASQATILNWQASLQVACYDAISAEDIRQIVQNQVRKAKEGDPNAIKFVMGNLLGSNRPVTINNTQVITDVEGAARMAKARSKDVG